MIKVGIFGFNEVDALQRLIPNLKEIGVPTKDIIFFDGPLEDFPHDELYSTDGTLDYLRKERIQVRGCGLMSHIGKQNERFDYIGDDMLLKLECDEYIKGNWDTFIECIESVRNLHPEARVLNIPWTDLNGQYTSNLYRAKLHLESKNWSIRDRHWHYYYKGFPCDVYKAPLVGGLHIFHDSSIRPDYREKQMEEFQKVYTPKENNDFWKRHDMDIPNNGVQCHPCGCTIGYVYYLDPNMKKKARNIFLQCKKHRGVIKKTCKMCHHEVEI